ncbi:MAG TPA: DUF3467 domain-containing protein [Syntrophales bacterium]|nr:DUF3467 domain-containing protein [Syntrophales bacterium]HPQ61130.1 DUF3467 domain-containing protein [Syntrophales bacterium]
MTSGPKEIKVNFPPSLHGGVYANNTVITHTREEFILDFIMAAPPAGSVTARVVVSPGHVKRLLATLMENISRYEQKYGEIPKAEEPPGTLRIN